MTTKEGKCEIVYQLTMSYARELEKTGIISTKEYEQFDTKMRQKYHPIIGTLFSNINLI